MQAYARAELAPDEPGFNSQQVCGCGEVANEFAADAHVGPGRSASSALAAFLLDGLDEDALGLLAKRLAPHLGGLEELNPAVPPVAYTVHSLAEELGVSPKTIRCAIVRGELRGVKRGARWIIPANAVNEWASPSKARRTTKRSCSPSAPKAAGPSLRSVLCGRPRGGSR